MLSRVMMVAGETSGDLHGSGVVRELRRRAPQAEIYGIGGDRMQREGMECLIHVSRLSFMGFLEVAGNLSVIRDAARTMERLLISRRPDVLVLIDYPGFNLRLAAKAKTLGIRILYYISPQVWAWHRGRVGRMRGVVDRMKVVFPFEVEIYRAAGIPVEWVGHPLVEAIGGRAGGNDFRKRHGFSEGEPLLALIPGSRRQEIERILPVMMESALRLRREREIGIALSLAPHIERAQVDRFIPAGFPLTVVADDTYGLMENADAAIVTSGTATLETGWFGTPMVVVYRTSPLTYVLGRLLVRVDTIGLVNIVAGERVVREFVQGAMTADRLLPEIRRLLDDREYASSIRRKLKVIRERLGAPGASARVAEGIIELAEAA